MPLPRALKKRAPKAKKKEVMAETMHDLKHGPHHKDRTHSQEVAIGLKQAALSNRTSPMMGGTHQRTHVKKGSKKK